MSIAVVLTLLLGMVGIFQGGLNRQMAEHIGVIQAITAGSLITTTLAFTALFFLWNSPSLFPDFFHLRSSVGNFKWWYIIPGFFGFYVIVTLPFVIYKIGAVKVTILLVGAQILASIFWDLAVEKIPLTFLKTTAMILAAISVLLATWEN